MFRQVKSVFSLHRTFLTQLHKLSYSLLPFFLSHLYLLLKRRFHHRFRDYIFEDNFCHRDTAGKLTKKVGSGLSLILLILKVFANKNQELYLLDRFSFFSAFYYLQLIPLIPG